MPHLHQFEGAHDVTVSLFVLRETAEGPRCLVHRHKKLQVWLQAGGHIEHDENPWQAASHELREETGYDLDQLAVLALLPLPAEPANATALIHPSPLYLKTHGMPPANGTHYHSDLVFAFVTTEDPRHSVGEGESPDLRWRSAEELSADPDVVPDCAAIYASLVRDVLPYAHRIAASAFSLADPPTWRPGPGRGVDANAL